LETTVICPKCKSKSKVYNSRPTDDGTIRRNRECLKCSHRYATIEVLADIKKFETRVVAKPAQPKKVVVTTKKKKKGRNANVRSYSSYDIDAMTDDELLEALDKGWVNPDDLD
jgi:transcriptional regulator NrdR family protein